MLSSTNFPATRLTVTIPHDGIKIASLMHYGAVAYIKALSVVPP